MHGTYTGARFSRFKPPKNHSFWDPISSQFSNVFWTPLRNTILEPLVPTWSPKVGFWDPLWIPLAPKMARKTDQEHHKSVHKNSKKRPKSAQGHKALWGPFLGTHFEPTWDPFGTPLGPIWDRFWITTQPNNPTTQQPNNHTTKQQKNKATRSNHTRLTGWGRRGREAI